MNTEIIIYHGSNHVITSPEYGFGSPYNDYGPGFYCTQHAELAREWACGDSRNGYANKYSLDVSDLNILDLNSPDYNLLHWITILLKHRIFSVDTDLALNAKNYLLEHFDIDTSGYDIIKGYRADDSYFSYARDFLHNSVSLRRLSQVMRLGDLGNQIVLISPKAFGSITFLGYEDVDAGVYFPLRQKRDSNARLAYLQDKAGDGFSDDDIFVLDIMRGNVKADDPRIQ